MIRAIVAVSAAAVAVYLSLRCLYLAAGDGAGWWSAPLVAWVAMLAVLAVALLTVPEEAPPEAPDEDGDA